VRPLDRQLDECRRLYGRTDSSLSVGGSGLGEASAQRRKDTTQDRHPKVFISHAGKDKERFVRSFARELRANGIVAWFNEWEIMPSDSLVGKLLGEGIGPSDAVVAVLSRHSVQSAWVRE
jgi:hypothetical protein